LLPATPVSASGLPAPDGGHAHEHLPDPARPYAAGLLIALALSLFVMRLANPQPWHGTFAAYFLAYTLEATPFILLGALLSGLLETLLPPSLLPRIARRLGPLGVPAVVLLSPLFPTCECGVVSIGRGLLRKGLPLGPALAYLLAAPILNPTVLWTTWLAFQDGRYVLWRALGGALVACGVGWALGRTRLAEALAEGAGAVDPVPAGNPVAAAASRRETQDGAQSPPPRKVPVTARLLHAFTHARQDFAEMMLYFLCGVGIAAAMKTFLSATLLTQLGHGAASGPAALMGTAFLLSLCSEADAFPAAGFTEFGFPAIIAFLVFGPMLDIKLLLMYRTLLRGRFLALYVLAISLGVALLAALLTLLGGPR
jgi:uncharacterized membrane protein YraQ (UPF0718 family)